MAKILVTIDLDPDMADEEHELGLTEPAYGKLLIALAPFGDFEIERDDG